MNKTFKIAALTAAIFSTTAMAEAPVYVTGGLSLFGFDTATHNMDKAVGPWLGLGYQLNDKWAIELDYHMADSDVRNANASGLNKDVDVSLLSLTGVYRYSPLGENSYLTKVGLGRQQYDSDNFGKVTETAIRLGAGYEYYFNQNLSATFMWDLLYSLDESMIDSLPNIGLKYQFGTTKAAKKVTKSAATVAPVTVAKIDSDSDGVADANDQCSNTPTGVRVNAQGCPFDRDADGIADYKDECFNTPAGAQVDDKGCRVQLTEKVSMELYVNFPLNSTEISREYKAEIKKVADFMRKYPDANVELVGHTDSSGPASYNLSLSKKRAQTVADSIVAAGVDSSRVSSTGKGEAEPLVSNDTRSGRIKNRRVTAEITATATK